jgi:hypothetical protein
MALPQDLTNGREDEANVSLTALDIHLLRPPVHEIDPGWSFKADKIRPRGHTTETLAIIMFWGGQTDFPRPTIWVQATSTRYMVTAFTFWRLLNGVQQDHTYFGTFDGVVGKLTLEARKVAAADRNRRDSFGALEVGPSWHSV